MRVWKSALDLAESVYHETADFPVAERYGLTSQMRRSAVSIAANIAEGKGRYGARQFAAFLDVAYGSLRELQALVILATRLGLLSPEAEKRIEESISLTASQLVKLAKHVRAQGRAP